MKAEIFDLYRGTTHDGPGLRCTVFFRGCPLRCAWCHNPEGMFLKPALWWDANRCIGCGTCEKICPIDAVKTDETGVSIVDNECTQCGLCVENCPSKALERISRSYTIEELVDELEKYEDYYTSFSGGVTASGGEAMLQSDFVRELFRSLRQKGISTALDTCGAVPYEKFEDVLPYTTYILYDLKIMNPALHEKWTGTDNEQIITNFCRILGDASSGKYDGDIWVRTPLIPGASATEENIRSIARFLRPYLHNGVSRWELCAFNNACTVKYRKLRRDWQFQNEAVLTRGFAERLRECAVEECRGRGEIVLTGILK